MDKTVT